VRATYLIVIFAILSFLSPGLLAVERDFYTQRIIDEVLSWQLVSFEEVIQDVFLNGVNELEGKKVSEKYHMVANIPARALSVYENGSLIKTYKIAVGTQEFKTPVAQMALKEIVWNPWWIPPDEEWAALEKPTPPGPKNPLGPVKMPLQDAIMFHGTNQPSSVGRPTSHGCMRMKSEDAVELAWFFQERLSSKKDPKFLRRYQRQRSESFPVRLDEAVSVELVYERLQTTGEKIVLHPDIYRRDPYAHNKVKDYLKNLGIDDQDIDQEKIQDLARQYRTMNVAVDDLLAPSQIVDEFFKPLNTMPRLSEEAINPSPVATPFSSTGPYSIPTVN